MADGIQFGWVSPATRRLLEEDNPGYISKEKAHWLTFCYIIGNMCGVLFSINIFNIISRKLSIFISCLFIFVGWLGLLISNSFFLFCLSRWIAGVGRNMIFVVIPMYIGEIARPNIRGKLGIIIYLMMNIGVLISYCLVPYFALFITPVIGMLITFVCMILICVFPESPYYLILHGHIDNAEKSIKFLKGEENVEIEINRIKQAIEDNTSAGHIRSLILLFTVRSNFLVLVILMFLRFVQQSSGIGVISLNIHSIFQEVEGTITTDTSAIVYCTMMITSCFFSMLVMDKFGRRPLLIISCIICFLCLALEGSYFYVKDYITPDNAWLHWTPLFCTVIFVYGYRVGLGTVPIIMIGELFAVDVKVTGVALTDFIYSLSSLSSNFVYYFTKEVLGMYFPFWIFAIVTLFAAIICYFFVPETKGKNLEEIQIMINKKS